MLKLAGTTDNNVRVINGTYKIYETDGVPLDVIFNYLKDNSCIPSWIDFYLDARDAGMKHGRILSMLEPAISDSFGSEVTEIVLKRLQVLKYLRKSAED